MGEVMAWALPLGSGLVVGLIQWLMRREVERVEAQLVDLRGRVDAQAAALAEARQSIAILRDRAERGS